MSIQKIPTRQLGTNGPSVSAIGLGTMGIGAFYGKTDMDEAFKALNYAADCGMTFWDCADIYGETEVILAKWFAETGRRDEIFLATKFGGRDPGGKFGGGKPISTPSYIKYAFERSMERLKTSHIDLYYQHRVDPNVPIEVVLEALREYVDSGKIKYIGLSECSPATLKRAHAVEGIGKKVIACQMEFSPFSLDIENEAFMKALEETGAAVVAYSPLGRGMVSGRFRSRDDFEEGDFRLNLPRFSAENFPKNLVLADKLKEIADKNKATPSQVTLAWILAEHPNFIPIPGCRTADRVKENAGGALLKLSSDDVKTIRQLSASADIQGSRYPDAFMHTTVGDCIPLSEWKGEKQA